VSDILDDAPTNVFTRRPLGTERELPPLLRVEEVAQLLRVNRKSAYAAVEAGAIPGVVRVGRSIRVSRDAVLDWLRGQGGVSRSRRNR
jgi:excisionase family DNA binding protein